MRDDRPAFAPHPRNLVQHIDDRGLLIRFQDDRVANVKANQVSHELLTKTVDHGLFEGTVTFVSLSFFVQENHVAVMLVAGRYGPSGLQEYCLKSGHSPVWMVIGCGNNAMRTPGSERHVSHAVKTLLFRGRQWVQRSANCINCFWRLVEIWVNPSSLS